MEKAWTGSLSVGGIRPRLYSGTGASIVTQGGVPVTCLTGCVNFLVVESHSTSTVSILGCIGAGILAQDDCTRLGIQ